MYAEYNLKYDGFSLSLSLFQRSCIAARSERMLNEGYCRLISKTHSRLLLLSAGENRIKPSASPDAETHLT